MLDDVKKHLVASGAKRPESPALNEVSHRHFRNLNERHSRLLRHYRSGNLEGILTHAIALAWEAMAALEAAGLDVECAWLEHSVSQRSLIDPETGLLFKDRFGHLANPPWFKPPNMKPMLEKPKANAVAHVTQPNDAASGDAALKTSAPPDASSPISKNQSLLAMGVVSALMDNSVHDSFALRSTSLCVHLDSWELFEFRHGAERVQLTTKQIFDALKDGK